MRFNLEKLDKNFVAVDCSATPEEIEAALAEAYKKVVQKVNLPGFRKGHIPRPILEKQFGKEVLYEDALDYMVTKGYLESLQKFDLHPIAQPKLEAADQLDPAQTYKFKINIEVLPEVKLGQYKQLEVEKKAVQVGEEQIVERLRELQERHAELVLSEKEELEKGDFAMVDFEGYIEGKPFPGGSAQAYTLEIGSGSFIPGFEEQMIGMKVGTEKEIRLKFPDDYQSPGLAGKDVVFKVGLKEIKVKEIPEINDEFAKSIGNFENVAAFKEDLKGKMLSMAQLNAEADFSQAAIDRAVENAAVEVPETLIKQEMEDLMRRFEHNLAYQGLNLEKYMEYFKKTKEELLEEFRPEAVKHVKTDLVLSDIAKTEQIEASEAELNEKIKELSTRYQQANPEKFRRDLEAKGRLSDIRQAIVLEKTADFIKENALPLNAE